MQPVQESLLAARSIVIAEYDPRWPAMFDAEKALIEQVAGDTFVQIEHIGSTSVSGLAAKPIIDIMAAVRRLEDAEAAADRLATIGYRYAPEHNVAMPERRYFRKGSGGASTHHLHVYAVDEFARRPERRFRDYLRRHPETAAEYAALKRTLAARFAHDRAAYTDAKAEFVAGVEALALQERDT
jgi:GrpB-like predicted nucleotidyltransferase (UPF0157 family)